MTVSKRKIGLCIGGGGAKGAAAIAIIEALLNQGIKFSAISGTSVGAIIAAYLAVHGEVSSLREKIGEMNKKDWAKLSDLTIGRTSLIKGEKAKKEYKEMYGEIEFKDVETKLVVTATNLQEGRVEYINSGKIFDAVAASSAYPGLFPPHCIDKKPYADGGILDNLPYQKLLETGMGKVIVINLLNEIRKTNDEFSTMATVIARSLDLLMAKALKQMDKPEQNVFMFAPRFTENRVTSALRFSQTQEYFKLGEREYKKKESELRKWLAE